MFKNDWSYALALYKEGGSAIGAVAVDVDWEPARQWVQLTALREGRVLREGGQAEVRPVWRDPDGPVIRGFRVAADADDGPSGVSCDFPTAYFNGLARAASRLFVESGRLQAGEPIRYRVVAAPREAAVDEPGRLGLVVEGVLRRPSLRPASLEALRAQSVAIGCATPHEVPAFVPACVLDEIRALTRQACPMETGGALVGHLHRDAGARQVLAVVRAQIPACHTEASAVRLSFTSETWAQFRAAIAARGQDEVMLGWWHSHPVREWRRLDEAPDADDGEPDASELFSEDDCAVHRTVFPGAHTIALVANDISTTDVTFSAYGWSLGMLQPRGLFVCEGPPS